MCLDCKEVTNDVPQGSMVRPQLFVLFINDLDNTIKGNMYKGANDTKIGGFVSGVDRSIKLQGDIDRLSERLKVWQLDFNTAICEVIQFGLKWKRIQVLFE